jgi:hypothetical protein
MQDSKSLLAKLLATENITVEHKKVSTAYFDTKNRVMVLPMWKFMSSSLYDLLLGHEVGHALNTPPDGWHDQVTDKMKKGFKTFLNVIEDVRIEKLIQNKFPGLKTSFRKGYSELVAMDFFGISKMAVDIDELPLIDRINLHYKVGSYLNVHFEDSEKYYIDRLDKLKTWEEVVQIATELYEYSKDESKMRDLCELEDFDDENEDDDMDDAEWEESDDQGSNKTKNGRQSGTGEEFDPESLTDKYFRAREKELLDDKVKPYVYANCPKPDLDKIIIPHKKIAENYDNFTYRSPVYDSDICKLMAPNIIESTKEKLYQKFLNTNKKYISYLVKEFELRKNANQFARAAISKTGKLDMKKVHQYKLNDDLFKRMTTVPKGKSHGLLMFVDYSGSMSENIGPTIEQSIVLAIFCRKVNIPFRVYAFTDSTAGDFYKELGISRDVHGRFPDSERKFSRNRDDIHLDDMFFRLREYLSSDMSGREFKNAIRYWLLAGAAFGNRNWSRNMHTDLDKEDQTRYIFNNDFENLNGTPLNEAIVSAIEIAKQFKTSYKLDVVNTVFLTDGDSNDTGMKYDSDERTSYLDKYNGDYTLIVRDPETKLEGKKAPRAETTVALLDLLKKVAGVNVIGFHIANYFNQGVVLDRLRKFGKYDTDFHKKYKEARRNKVYIINDAGFDDYYIIPGGKNLQIKDDEMDVDANAKKSELKNAFLKMQRGKSINRVLLSRFAEKIA